MLGLQAACSRSEQAELARSLGPTVQLQPRVGSDGELLDLPQFAGGLRWHSVSAQTGPVPVASFVPEGQSRDDWREMIAATALSVSASPGAAAQARLATLTPACAQSEIHWLSGAQSDGGFDVFVSCTRAPPQARSRVRLPRHEAVWLRGVFGRKANYLIMRSWRGDTTAASVVDSTAVRAEWRAWFGYVGISGHDHRRPPDPDALADPAAPVRMTDVLRGISAR